MSLQLGSANSEPDRSVAAALISNAICGPQPKTPPESMEVVREPSLTFALGGAEQEFECGICMQLASDPVLTSCCGTTYCESCAGKLDYPTDYPAGARRCPICRKPMWTSKNRALRAVLENAPATCKTCGATVSGATAEEHFAKYCPAVEVKCSRSVRGCTWTGTRADFHANHDKGCNFTDAFARAELRRLLYLRDPNRDKKLERVKRLLRHSVEGSDVSTASVLSPLALYNEINAQSLQLLDTEITQLTDLTEALRMRHGSCERKRLFREVLKSVPETAIAGWLTPIRSRLSGPASFLAWEAPYVRRIGRALSELQVQDLVDIGVFVAHPRELYEKALSHFAVERWKRLHNRTRKNGMEFDVTFPVTLPESISLERSLMQMKSLASDLNADRDLLTRRPAPKNESSVNIDKNARAVIQNIARHFDFSASARAPAKDHVLTQAALDAINGLAARLLLGVGRMEGHIPLVRVLTPIIIDYVHEAAYRRAFIEHAGANWPLEAASADESTMLMTMPSEKLEERLLEAGRRTLGLVDKELQDFVYTGRYDKCDRQSMSFYWAQATPTFCYTHTDHAYISCMSEDFEDLTLWGLMFAKDDYKDKQQRSTSSANTNKRKNATDAGETTGGGGAGNGNRDGSQEICALNPTSKRARTGSS